MFVFTVLLKTDEAEWEWIVPLEDAQRVWEILGTPTRTDIRSQAVGHGELESGL